jgi:hypothetical protein
MQTGLQIINEVEDRLGWPQSRTIEDDLSKTTRKLLRLLNRVLHNLVSAEVWPLLRAYGTLVTQATVSETMVMELTNGSDVVEISGTDTSGVTFELHHRMWAIQFGSNTPIYRILEITTPTQIKLNRPWLGDTSTTDEIAVVFGMDRYALPEDFDRPTGKWKDFLSAYSIEPLGPEDFDVLRQKRGRNIEIGDPTHYTVYGLDPSNTYQLIHFDPWPTRQTMMEFTYQMEHPTISTDRDLVLFPMSQVSVVIEAMLYLANRDYEDDTKLQVALREYLVQFNAAKSQSRVTDDTKILSPWTGMRARSSRLRGNAGGIRYDYGTYFDRVDAVGLE